MTQFEDPFAQKAHTRFVRRSMSEPLLSREDEFALARAWREQGDEDALHSLIRSYTRLAVSIATKFRNYGLPVSDLVQEGVIGLMQAANRFEPDRDIRFSTYASWWIRSSIQDFILRNWSIVRTGTTAAQKTLFFNLRRLRARIEESSGAPLNQDGRELIAQELSVAIGEVENMENRLSAADQSLNAVIGDDGEGEWQDFLTDDRASPEDLVVGTFDGDMRKKWIHESIAELTPREQRIIRARRLVEDGATLEELGKVLGVSKERVRQLEHRALLKLKSSMSKHVDQDQDLLLEG